MIKIIFLSIMLFIWSSAFSSSDGSDLELYKKSNIVALVVIEEGNISDGFYKVRTKVLKQFKGMGISETSIIHNPRGWSDVLARLGGTYLVHLAPCTEKICKTLEVDFSVVEVGSFDSARPDFSLVLEKLKLDEENTFKYEGFYWYSVACINQSDRKICKETTKILQSTFNKVSPEE